MTTPKKISGEWVRWGLLVLVMIGGWLIAYGRTQAQAEDLGNLPPRVAALEKVVEVEKVKRESDREVLDEVRQDVKDIRNALLREGRRGR